MNNMKRIILFTIMMLMTLIMFGQLPVNENFNSQPTTWTNNNGSGYYNYGGGNYTLTTNINQYPNSSTITMLSPIYNLSSCVGLMTVSFLLNGEIENTYDIMRFQYLNSSNVWITLQTFTGVVNNQTYSYTSIPNTSTRFRFRLITDFSVNPPWYYYDIDNFSITCSAYLPIELLTFDGFNKKENNILTWSTASENNNDYFTIERSEDGVNWKTVDSIDGAGNSTQLLNYTTVDNNFREVINYYRLSQTDYNGTREFFKIIAIDNRTLGKTILKVVNTLGQEVDITTSGIIFIIYTNGEIQRKFNI